MSNKIKKGFTIVELLIVIVVIGILATIVVTTYQGVQDKANTTKNQTNAKQIKDKAEAYNSLNTEYPASETAFTDTNADPTVKVSPEVATALSGTPSETSRESLDYSPCGTPATGGQVKYWSYEKKQVITENFGTGC